MQVRLQKFLADAGVASRRACEEYIQSGRVAVNGQLVRMLGSKVDSSRDKVVVDGRLVRSRKKFYLALHKPRGYVCTRSDEKGRRKVMDLLPKEWAHLYPVGRLDKETEGLLLLTNDGDFSLHMTHPRYQITKKYMASLIGRVRPAQLERMRNGIVDKGETLKAKATRLHEANNSHSVVELDLTEGKNREVRRLFESQKITVERLIRIQIGQIRLGELPSGKWRTLTESEIKSLLGPL